MSNTLKIASRWWWLWLIHGLFILVMYQFFFLKQQPWLSESFRGIGLSFEMNYAVWWSGICLYIAALVFFRNGQLDINKRSSWVILGLTMLALCFDEIGSLHEAVSQAAGWQGLLPFATIFGAGLGWALVTLIRDPDTRIVAILIALGVGIFGAVAGLEFVEHNIEISRGAQRLRLVTEEGLELIAMGILISAGLIGYLRLTRNEITKNDPSIIQISNVIGLCFIYRHYLFLIFALQLTAVIAFVIPNHSLFLEGNVASLFPVLLFMSMGLYCLLINNARPEDGGWFLLGILFIGASLLQLYNLTRFVNQLFHTEWEILLAPPASWLMTLIPWIATVIIGRTEDAISFRKCTGHLLAILFVLALLMPKIDALYLVDYLYFIFSSCVAYSCFNFLCDILNQNQAATFKS